jgi:putative DNA primase/helicase
MDAEKRKKLIPVAVYRLLHELLHDVTKTGPGQYLARCVFHSPDNNPSMSVNAEKGLVHCFSCGKAGDALEAYQAATSKDFAAAVTELEAAAGIATAQDDHPSVMTSTKSAPKGPHTRRRKVADFEYRDQDGKRRYWKERWEPGENGRRKDFYFYHQGKTGKAKGRGGEPVLYRLPELAAAPLNTPIFITEGERKADLLNSWGLIATSTDSGAQSPWKDSYTPFFAGRTVVILPDNDTPGEKYAVKIASVLHGTAASVKIVRLPGLEVGEDVIEWAEKGGPV